jgi:hypothetical protein
MQSEKSRDHNDHHHHYADDVKNIQCFAPIEATIGSTELVCFSSRTSKFLTVARS